MTFFQTGRQFGFVSSGSNDAERNHCLKFLNSHSKTAVSFFKSTYIIESSPTFTSIMSTVYREISIVKSTHPHLQCLLAHSH